MKETRKKNGRKRKKMREKRWKTISHQEKDNLRKVDWHLHKEDGWMPMQNKNLKGHMIPEKIEFWTSRKKKTS